MHRFMLAPTSTLHAPNPQNQAGENHGENLTLLPGARSADEIKQMHTILADLTDDELKSITVLPAGTHLEQGAKYIDLMHLAGRVRRYLRYGSRSRQLLCS